MQRVIPVMTAMLTIIIAIIATLGLCAAQAYAVKGGSGTDSAQTEAAELEKQLDAAKDNTAKAEAAELGKQLDAAKANAAKAEPVDLEKQLDVAKDEIALLKKELEAAKEAAEAAKSEAARYRKALEAVTPMTITYEPGEGALPANAKTKLWQKDGTYQLPTPFKKGFDFEGWYVGSKRVTTVSRSDWDVTVTARWSEMERVYVYVDAGRRLANKGEKIYELYIMKPAHAPKMGDSYKGGTVVAASGRPDGKGHPAGSITLLDETAWYNLKIPDMQQCTEIDLHKAEMSHVTDMSRMFFRCSSLTSLNLSGWDTSGATNMNHMFFGCSSLTSLDLSGWDTSRVKNMSDMFYRCSSLTSLNLSGWDTSNVTDMECMFSNCSSLTSLDIIKWNTSKVTNMERMFYCCSSLTSLYMPRWNTSNVTSLSSTFYGCDSLITLNIRGWDTRNVTNMQCMLYDCASLESLNLWSWNTSSATDMRDMFGNCASLKDLDLSRWDTSRATDMHSMFSNCISLESLKTGKGWSYKSAARNRPDFPKTMYDKAGGSFSDTTTVPEGAHTYTATRSVGLNAARIGA